MKRSLKRTFLLTLLLLAGLYLNEALLQRPPMSYAGLPSTQAWDLNHLTRIFRNDGFILGYSDLRGNPLWVVYRISPIPKDAPYHKRPRYFSSDWRSISRIGHDDYSHSGYSRGHLAPNYAITRLYGREAQLDTFLMSNVSPQSDNLNRKLWQRLEEVEIDEFTKIFGEIWVYTGPIFDPEVEHLRTSNRVEIPDAFFKIYLAPGAQPDKTRMLAFVMPQDVRGDEPLDRYLVSVDRVEELTGFDFFPEMEDTLENRLEAAIESHPWQLKKLARRPARY